ncbi:SAVED domain-containing protein [Lichenihabitans sp. Uapishka_5]|uniref:SAVED domain-containing protein n=1 Tax=Lichenihabitans sp. Uapishka_5 TaxID=3037302 RepID=UPI0029E7DF40|nr:SAVED domain-containing protein [Lichenihabitans sp. Uapishka_5]MDX7952129.1 SAVED domain-containing protein [Lichenihabitans sp. Uapishka_5]
MTNPTGVCFLSYKRERASEAGLLVEAFYDHGIQTWQDISDLPIAVTEAELERVIAEDTTSSAVMLVTPEVAKSDVIRKVEAPGIMTRVRAGDGFFAVPVAAGGLGYADVGSTLGPMIGLTEMSGFNILKAATDPLDTTFAALVAQRALRERLAAVEKTLAPGEPITMRVSTRVDFPKGPGFALSADLRHRFDGRHAKAGAWNNHLLPAIATIAKTLRQCGGGHPLELSGFPSLPTAVALGSALPSIGPIEVRWLQEQTKFGSPAETWSLKSADAPCGFKADTHPYTPSASDLALLVSVTNDVTHDFRLSSSGLPLRAVVHVAPPDPRPARIQLNGGEAKNLACFAIDSLRSAAAKFGARGTIHLFLAVPAGLAVMIGQQLNTFGRVQTYEHDPAASVPYTPAALLSPSS